MTWSPKICGCLGADCTFCCYHGHRCLSSVWHTMCWWEAVEGKQPSALHLSPSHHYQRGRELWLYSTLVMYVNTNVKTQKHILSFYYETWKKNSWFLVIVPADVLQWFKEVRRFFVRFSVFLKILSCFIQTRFCWRVRVDFGNFQTLSSLGHLYDLFVCVSMFEPHIFCLYYFLLKVFILRSRREFAQMAQMF